MVRSLVIGAASGRGRVIAEAMVDAGADVPLVDTDVDAVASTVQDASGRSPALDVVFANAGIAGARRADGEAIGVEQVRQEDWDRVLSVQLGGALHTIQAATG